MAKPKLRESIAAEAARLMLRGKEREYAAARKRAARWLSRRKVLPEDLPSNAEIETQLYAISGLFADEQQRAALASMRRAAWELMQVLGPFDPRLSGPALDGPVIAGAEILLRARTGTPDEIAAALESAGHRVRIVSDTDAAGAPESAAVRLTHRYPCVVVTGVEPQDAHELDAAMLEELMVPDEFSPPSELAEEELVVEDDYHPDTFPLLRIMLERLRNVKLDPVRHPEGDALYHSLQVYALGLQESPYDEEFLLSCLLHDVGLAIDRRNPVVAAIEALRGVVTERTCFLIQHRQAARDYLRTGRISKSLRKGEHFDDLVLLAQCDLHGRVPGAVVPSLDEALANIEGLSSAWDDFE